MLSLTMNPYNVLKNKADMSWQCLDQVAGNASLFLKRMTVMGVLQSCTDDWSYKFLAMLTRKTNFAISRNFLKYFFIKTSRINFPWFEPMCTSFDVWFIVYVENWSRRADLRVFLFLPKHLYLYMYIYS